MRLAAAGKAVGVAPVAKPVGTVPGVIAKLAMPPVVSAGVCPSRRPRAASRLLISFQARLAEVLVRQQFLLADLQQVAERADVHLLQRVAAADRQLEIRDRDLERGIPLGVGVRLVDEHRAGRHHVLQVQPRPLVVRVADQHRVEAALGLVVEVVVLVQDREVH